MQSHKRRVSLQLTMKCGICLFQSSTGRCATGSRLPGRYVPQLCLPRSIAYKRACLQAAAHEAQVKPHGER